MLDFTLDKFFGISVAGLWSNGFGSWLAEFLKSPALGGVGAVIAAFIAFKSVTRQVDSNRRIADQKS